jgi:CBS domain-containing protein
MLVHEAATMNIATVLPEDSLYVAARKMGEFNIGFLPVLNPMGSVTGVVTDRDIVVKGVAEARDPQETRVADVMVTPAHWIYEDAELADAAAEMMHKNVRRLVVKNHLNGTVGVISLHDIARNASSDQMAAAILRKIAPPPPAMAGQTKSGYDWEE